ncbi:NAD(P)H-binding protein [Streptomyces sp. RPA4-5]|uniref:NAD(P)H-binding protein n=1 Tax=Streptomyces sp. RPA4-5 TaxID=2721245 RepID=UPI0024941B86|nr:NAD(P)H-binding protein [Streptomyces sp. RPA4-5]
MAAAREAGVRHVVKFSTSGVSFDATDPLTSGHRAGEQVIQESDLDWTILRPGTFMIYLYGYADSIGKERTMYVTEGNPVSAMIHPRDIASVAAKVLTTSGHEGQTYTLTGGEALSPQRQGEIIGEALGQKVKVVERTAAETQADFDRLGWGGPRLAALLELKRQSAAWDWNISDSVQQITGMAPLTLRNWVDENIHVYDGFDHPERPPSCPPPLTTLPLHTATHRPRGTDDRAASEPDLHTASGIQPVPHSRRG